MNRGDSEGQAEETAARTVNKARARAGEAAQTSRTSLKDIYSGKRGGLRSHKGAAGRTGNQHYEEVRRKSVKRAVGNVESAIGVGPESLIDR